MMDKKDRVRLKVFCLRSALITRPKAMILRSKTKIITSFEAIILRAKKILQKLFRNRLQLHLNYVFLLTFKQTKKITII